MPRYAKNSQLSPGEIGEKAVSYFGPGGVGLEITEMARWLIRFQGGGGHVLIESTEKEDSTEVEIVTREWDYHVKEFMKTL
ncbi:MAG: hypothetical protein PVF58_11080 [Candidatus Methanofastidiosia archaeon]|jgi:hypothetical protein